MAAAASSTTGINRGYLFKIGDEGRHHVYVASGVGLFNPFTNPKFAEIFQAAEMIASDVHEVVSLEMERTAEEVLPKIREFAKKIPALLKNSASAEELALLKELMQVWVQQMKVPLPDMQGKDDATQIVGMGLLAFQQWLVNRQGKTLGPSSQERSDFQQRLKSAQKETKSIADRENPFSEGLKIAEALFMTPTLLRAFFSIVTERPDLLAELVSTTDYERGFYLEAGNGDSRIDEFLTSKGFNVREMKRLADQKFPEIRVKMHEKVSSLMESNKKILFILSPHAFDSWHWGVHPLKQIKIPLKPGGFLWRVTDSQGNSAHIVGTMHVTANKLVNFPSQWIEILSRSVALSLEIDTSRPEVRERMQREFSWGVVQRKQLELLTEAERTKMGELLSCEPTMDALMERMKGMGPSMMKGITDIKDRDSGEKMWGDTGIDKELRKVAQDRQIPVKDLETYDEHFGLAPKNVAMGYAPVVTAEVIRKKLEELEDHSIDKILSDYYSGKLDSGIEKCLVEDRLQEMTDIMEHGNLEAMEAFQRSGDQKLDSAEKADHIKRNLNMAMRIREWLSQGMHFHAFGVAHAVGPSNVLEFLRQFGCRVERLIFEEPI
jgi:uncharacterized protein YbaP (TraB family)